MRDYGIVRARFWAWAKEKELSLAAKELALYCLTSPHTVGIGCFRLPISYIAEDLGTVPDTVRYTVSELSRIGFLRHDEKLGWIWIVGFLDHNPIANANVAKSLMPFLDAIPRKLSFYKDFIDCLKDHVDRYPDRFRNGFPDGYIDGLANGMPNHDQEHEHEHHHDQEHEHEYRADAQSCEREAFDLYNEACEGTPWPAAQRFNATRQANLKRRLAECGGIDGWKVALAKARASPFVMAAGWFSLDWMLKPANFTKLFEGNYDDKPGSNQTSGLTAALAGLAG